ncbi:hypothetical protein [Azospirillum tabaci]|uniref:hypothetical protein n=1 Tax=Azospirillum tabaci TaxID=2752310 RepID=UPI001660D7EC|nr:hypothetical protein [Azospirillum tabaci]
MTDAPEWTPITPPWVGAVLRVGRVAGLVSPVTAGCWLWRVDGIGGSPGYSEAETEAAARAAVERCLLDVGVLTAHQAADLARCRARQSAGDHDAS